MTKHNLPHLRLFRPACYLLFGLPSLLAPISSLAAEGVITSAAFTGDADSGVNAAKTYVALGNIVGGNVTVNGVTFLGTGLSGTGWALSGVANGFGSGGNHTTTFGGSTIDDLFDAFQYNGSPGTLTMSGLTVGQTYVTTLYNQAWGLGANRTQTVTAGDGSSLVYNQDALEASVLRYTFVATGTSTTLNFLPTIPGNTMHFYGMSTEQVFNNTWTPTAGNSWNTAGNWATGLIPNAVGANALFSAQGGPTTVTLDSPVTVGHTEFLGTGNYTVSGANTLTLQSDVGGVAVLKADAGLHTISTPLQLNSALSKFGAGTIKLSGTIAGANHGVQVAAGGLTIESSTANLSPLGNVSNAGTFTVSSASNQTFGGVVSGAGVFEKSGSGVLTLNSPQDYTGPTVISGGTLKLSVPLSLAIANHSFETYDALGGGSYGYQPSGASWTFASHAGISLNGGPFYAPTNHDGIAGAFIQGQEAVVGSISQVVTVTDAGTYTFSFQGASRTGAGPNGLLFKVDGITYRTIAPAEFSATSWADFTVAVPLSAGAHTIEFAGNNVLGGDRSSVIDKVAAQTGGKLPSMTAVNLTASGATLDLTGLPQTIGSLAGVTGSSVLSDAALTVGGNNTSTVFDGVVSGSGSLTKVGTGTMTVGGGNTYTGPTVVNAGTVQLASGGLLPSTSLQLASGGTFDLNGNPQTMPTLTGAAGSAVTLGSGTFTVGDAANTNSTHAGSLSGTGSLVKAGSGRLTLSGPTSYSGGTTISGGTLQSLSSNTSNVGVMSVAGGAAWDLTTESHTVSGLTGGGTITRQGILSTGADGAALISTAKNYLQKLDFGNNGGATVNGVAFDSVGNSGTGFSLTGATALFGGSDTGGYDQMIGDFLYNGNPGTLTLSSLIQGQTYEAVIYTKIGQWPNRAQNATFDDDGAGPNSQVLSSTDPGTVGYYAYRFVAPSTSMSIRMAPVSAGNTFHWFGASLESVATARKTLTTGDAGSYNFSGAISGATTLVKQGTGTQTLSGASTYLGGTDILAGAILANHPQAISTGDVNISSGANYLAWWNGTPQTITPTIKNNFTLNGPGGVDGKPAIYADGGTGALAEYTITGGITLAATSNLGGNVSNNLRVSGLISGPGGLTKGGTRVDENNTLILGNANNSYEGDTVVAKGTLKLGASNVIPHGAGKGGLSLQSGTTLDLGGFSETVNKLSGSGNIVSTASVGTPVYFSDDAGTGISSSKTYTHALDFAEGSSVTINGVPFTGAGLTGGNWAITGANPSAGSPATGATGDISRLLTNFYYGGNPGTLTLTGLAPGQTYEARLYERAWGGNRTQRFTVDAGGGTGFTLFDEDASSIPSFIPFRYTANSIGQAVITTNQIGDGSYHWFGVSNEVVENTNLTFGDNTNQAFAGSISGPTGLTKQGTGTQTFSGTNTYTGPTNLNGGTLLLGSASALSPSSNLTLSGATLSAGGFTNAGAILSQTTGNNVIDFSSGDGQLTFSNTGTWTGVLSIWNYVGAPWASGTDKLFFGTNSLTAGDLSNIHFYSGPGTGQLDTGGAAFLPSGELVPVPETSTSLISAGLALLALSRETRRRRRNG